jgi:hypothetical protein
MRQAFWVAAVVLEKLSLPVDGVAGPDTDQPIEMYSSCYRRWGVGK